MESSVTYQQTAQLHESIGEERGEVNHAKKALLGHYKRRLGTISEADEKVIHSVNNLGTLDQATAMFVDGTPWEQVIAFLTDG